MADDKKTNGKRAKKPTAQKRDEQSLRRNLRNRSFKSKVNTAVRGFEDLVTKKDSANIKAQLSSVYSLMDKGVKKGVFKANKANRVKSRLTAKAKQLSV